MQPHPMTSVMQLGVTFAALVIAAAAAYFAIHSAREARNAALVSIGVAVLRADPGRESQVTAAREWALDLIDTNAGGVKFSPAARALLLQNSLPIDLGSIDLYGPNLGYADTYGDNLGYADTYGPRQTHQPRPAASPKK